LDIDERRNKIINILNSCTDPISGNQLSKLLGVSRQIIVQDIAVLRASNHDIVSTSRGYMIPVSNERSVRRTFLVKHNNDDIKEELLTIVDNGGKILDVLVSHEIYGKITTELLISNRNDVYNFVNKVNENKIVPLKELTGSIHSHTVEADSIKILDRIERALKDKNFLIIP